MNFIYHFVFLVETAITTPTGQKRKEVWICNYNITHSLLITQYTTFKYNFLIKTKLHGGHLEIFVHFEIFNVILILTWAY